ncbi:MAG: hypothetical protein JXO44_04830, partial [Clostridia bacterium]|nr:hypothetical protein [Clostridia bacterium]
NKIKKLSAQWISQARKDFRSFLKETKFPNPVRLGERGPDFVYPEWLIMFIAILSVKCKLKNYLAIHRMVKEYWEVISQGLKLRLISERQLRDRLKKICHFPGKPAAFIFQVFPELEQRQSSKR